MSVRHVVVDGSNLATEGRSLPSLVQLDEAVRAYMVEDPNAEIIVVVDASFEHRVDESERARFKEAEVAGELITPPAGAVGRGDAFILKIAERAGAVVLSNDSFQEFHGEHPWLFDEGRLIGGKPVRGVGWIFTPRLPVRGVKSQRATNAAKKTSAPAPKLVVKLPGGATPSIGDTLTPPVKKAATKRVAKRVASEPVAEVLETTPPVKKAATKRVAKKVASEPVAEPAPRHRAPVNGEEDFRSFARYHRPGSKVTAVVHAFTSHGALVHVTLRSGAEIECYAPKTGLASPPPPRARDVLRRGEQRSFTVVSVDLERRTAEVSLI
ncbi:MAG: hypothetical protein KGR42_07370 [Acidobacteria bacterium]|nr:hypothetical protein [Acidobacteriota bacterium]